MVTSSFSSAKWHVFCLFISTLAVSWAIAALGENFTEIIHEKCSLTSYQGSCKDTLLATQGLESSHGVVDLVSSLVEKTLDETWLPSSTLDNMTSQLHGMNRHAHEAISYCDELVQLSLKRLNQSLTTLKASPTDQSKHDIPTWLSAVLTFLDTCRDEMASVDIPGTISSLISTQMDRLSELTDNALALANIIPSDGVGNRRRTSDAEIPRWLSAKDGRLLASKGIQANVVVAKDGSGNFNTISAAIQSAPGDRRYVIHVKAGIYKEKVIVNKDNVMLIGDGKDGSIITSGDSFAGGSAMKNTATVTVLGDGFIARDIGFENTAGPQGRQALAIRVAADRAALHRCSFRGYQDTIFAQSFRQFYRDCDIYGTIDFIFGNAAAVFQNCNILLRRPGRPGAFNVIFANGRMSPNLNTGFVAQNCKIGAGPELLAVRAHTIRSYLGRPWKKYSRAVIMQSNIDGSIERQGWREWSGGSDLTSLYFAEYLNSGPGADTTQRVKWPGYHVIGTGVARQFTVGNYIGGMRWLPSTGVNFDADL